MEELDFSVFAHEGEGARRLRSVLEDFEAQSHIRVRLTIMSFDDAWSRLVQMALYKDGPDVSAVGTTWVSDLVRMNALRPYQPAEARALGGEASFISASWRSATMTIDVPTIGETAKTLWGMPWLADTRIVCYRRDLFEQAGIDPRTAFLSAEQFEAALNRLQASGVESPLVLPTHESWIAFHTLASWLWGSGGTFLNADDTAVTFHLPAAREGLKKFFRLGRYVSPAARNLSELEANAMFYRGEAAVTFGGHWLLTEQNMDPAMKAKMDIARVPGVPFVGGYHLVVWSYSRRVPSALKLVNFLTGPNQPQAVFPIYGLPTRREILEMAGFMQTPPFSQLAPLLQEGRSFPSAQMWGSIEKRWVEMIPMIWRDVFASEDPDLDKILEDHVAPLARRLNLSLQSLK